MKSWLCTKVKTVLAKIWEPSIGPKVLIYQKSDTVFHFSMYCTVKMFMCKCTRLKMENGYSLFKVKTFFKQSSTSNSYQYEKCGWILLCSTLATEGFLSQKEEKKNETNFKYLKPIRNKFLSQRHNFEFTHVFQPPTSRVTCTAISLKARSITSRVLAPFKLDVLQIMTGLVLFSTKLTNYFAYSNIISKKKVITA